MPHYGRPRAQREPKKDITWVNPPAGYGLTKRAKPERYKDPGEMTVAFKERLVVGAPMVAVFPLKFISQVVNGVDAKYPFRVMGPGLRTQRSRQGCVDVPQGAMLLYAGTVRVVERVRIHGVLIDMEVPKHTFVAPGCGRIILHDLSLVKHL